MGDLFQFIPILLILGVMYFVLIKPQADERAAHEALLASLSKDDHVVTTGGVHGWVVSVDEEQIHLEIAKNTQIVLDKHNVIRRIESDGKK